MDIILIATVCSMVGLGLAFPAGPPVYPEVCTGMTPKVLVEGFPLGHGANPQNPTSNPFEVLVDTTCYNENTKIQVWISSKPGTDNKIKGFLLQARLADNYTTGYHPLDGTFESVKGYEHTAPNTCPTALGEDAENNVFAHKEEPIEAPVTSGVYTPGTEHNQKDIIFVATVVEHQQVYWTFETSDTIPYQASCKQLDIEVGSGSTSTKSFTLRTTLWLTLFSLYVIFK